MKKMCYRRLHDIENQARSATAWDELTFTQRWQLAEAILRDSELTFGERLAKLSAEAACARESQRCKLLV